MPLALLASVLRAVLRRPRDSIGRRRCWLAAVAILINALFMQSGPHPAPIFAIKPRAGRGAAGRSGRGAAARSARPPTQGRA